MEPGKGKDLGAWENVQKGHENGLVRPRYIYEHGQMEV